MLQRFLPCYYDFLNALRLDAEMMKIVGDLEVLIPSEISTLTLVELILKPISDLSEFMEGDYDTLVHVPASTKVLIKIVETPKDKSSVEEMTLRASMVSLLKECLDYYRDSPFSPALLGCATHLSYCLHLELLVVPKKNQTPAQMTVEIMNVVKDWFMLINKTENTTDEETSPVPHYLNQFVNASISPLNEKWNEGIATMEKHSEKAAFFEKPFCDMGAFLAELKQINERNDLGKLYSSNIEPSSKMLKATIQVINSCPASSAAAERTFSACGNVDGPHRNQLADITFQKLVICHQYLRSHLSDESKMGTTDEILTNLVKNLCEFKEKNSKQIINLQE